MLEVFSTQFWGDIVWALLHSIWQAAIIALLLGLVLRQISAKKASLRYWIAVSAIASMVLASFFTYHVRVELRNSATSPIAEVSSPAVSAASVSGMDAIGSESTSSLPVIAGFDINWTALVALIWVTGVSVMVIRTISAVFNGNQLTSVAPVESSKYLDLLKEQSRKLGLTSVPSLWSSASSHTPYAIGVLSPAIVVPMSMLTTLSTSELQAVLAHELAHV